MLGRAAIRTAVLRGAARSTRSFSGSRAAWTEYGPGSMNLPMNTVINVVPEQSAWVLETFGRFTRVLTPGLQFLIPFVHRIAYVHSLKEETIPIDRQTAITKDNVTISLDGVLYIQIVDPHKASYGVSDAIFAMKQLAQTTMRSELGKLTLDKTFEERETLNHHIVAAINSASASWGVNCLRYEIRDIVPPTEIKKAMELEAEAERKKRADILTSEGMRTAAVNKAEGLRQATALEASGHAEAAVKRAHATAESMRLVSAALVAAGGREAVAMRLAEQYIDAFGKIAQAGNTVVLPANAGDVSGMVTQALSVFQAVSKRYTVADATTTFVHAPAPTPTQGSITDAR